MQHKLNQSNIYLRNYTPYLLNWTRKESRSNDYIMRILMIILKVIHREVERLKEKSGKRTALKIMQIHQFRILKNTQKMSKERLIPTSKNCNKKNDTRKAGIAKWRKQKLERKQLDGHFRRQRDDLNIVMQKTPKKWKWIFLWIAAKSKAIRTS